MPTHLRHTLTTTAHITTVTSTHNARCVTATSTHPHGSYIEQSLLTVLQAVATCTRHSYNDARQRNIANIEITTVPRVLALLFRYRETERVTCFTVLQTY
jgi:hypothetical protein